MMNSLKDIALQLLDLAANEDKYEMIIAVAKPLKNQDPISVNHHFSTISIPEVFINAAEVKRLLKTSYPTIKGWIDAGLIILKKNEDCPTNKFLLSEILWLQRQKYTFLNPGDFKRLIVRKNEQFKG